MELHYLLWSGQSEGRASLIHLLDENYSRDINGDGFWDSLCVCWGFFVGGGWFLFCLGFFVCLFWFCFLNTRRYQSFSCGRSGMNDRILTTLKYLYSIWTSNFFWQFHLFFYHLLPLVAALQIVYHQMTLNYCESYRNCFESRGNYIINMKMKALSL